jgi:hypothetical protein
VARSHTLSHRAGRAAACEACTHTQAGRASVRGGLAARAPTSNRSSAQPLNLCAATPRGSVRGGLARSPRSNSVGAHSPCCRRPTEAQPRETCGWGASPHPFSPSRSRSGLRGQPRAHASRRGSVRGGLAARAPTSNRSTAYPLILCAAPPRAHASRTQKRPGRAGSPRSNKKPLIRSSAQPLRGDAARERPGRPKSPRSNKKPLIRSSAQPLRGHAAHERPGRAGSPRSNKKPLIRSSAQPLRGHAARERPGRASSPRSNE